MNLPLPDDHPSSEFQRAIAVVETLAIAGQEGLVRLRQGHLRSRRGKR